MSEHSKDCAWHQDYNSCDCGALKEHFCLEVIPGTFIMCGEAGWYCSNECLEKSKDK